MESSDMYETVAESHYPGEAPEAYSESYSETYYTPPPSPPEPPRTPKWLLSAVIIMGILIIIGVVALVWVVFQRFEHHKVVQNANLTSPVSQKEARTQPQPQLPEAVLTPPARLNLIMRKGEHLQSLRMRTDGTIAVDLKADQGDERILIWVPEQARISAELELKSESESTLK